jgi:dihydroorotate dehydrogenase (fumarate)
MNDLSTRYLGLELKNPLVCSSSPLCQSIEGLRQMEKAGAAAVVLHSLFEEQIALESLDLWHNLEQGTNGYAESPTYLPDMTRYNLGPEGYLRHLEQAKKQISIPVIASLNGYTRGGWVQHATLIEEAGADGLELNIYEVVTDPERAASEVEDDLVGLVSDVVREVRIPVAVKLGPFFTAPAHLARRIAAAGARGLVLFNRFYQPDFDLELLDVVPRLWLSTAEELRLRLHWVALLKGRVEIDLAITGGVQSAQDVLKALMAGANVAMMTSALLRHGIDHITHVLSGLEEWMTTHETHSLGEIQGSMSFQAVPNPAVFERANYLKVLRAHALGASPR